MIHITETNKMGFNFRKNTAIFNFRKNQTLKNIEELKKNGVGLKVLRVNKWEPLCEYKLPFDRYILLHDKDFKITDIGVY